MKKAGPTNETKCTTVHLEFESENEIKLLDYLKEVTGCKTAKKAVIEALFNYPVYLRSRDELIDWNKKIAAELEKLNQIKKAFQLINDHKIKNPFANESEI